MEIKIAENIRSLRKEKKLTQEQLAEVFGVTVGAVHKWEAGLSVPDIKIIMDMADYFDLSVDVLLGYEMKDNGPEAFIKRIQKNLDEKNPNGVEEAEKALSKYPNNFMVVTSSALFYLVIGPYDEKRYYKRAYELFEQALLLIDQKGNSGISEMSIYSYMAQAKLMLGEGDEAVEILKKNNCEGIYNDIIGYTLTSFCHKHDEAEFFLSYSLIQSLRNLTEMALGMANVYISREDYESAEQIIKWFITITDGLKKEDTFSIVDKYKAVALSLLAYVYLKSIHATKAVSTYKTALEVAKAYDANPNYDANSIRFVKLPSGSVHDLLGKSALDGIEKVFEIVNDEKTVAKLKRLAEE